MAKTLQETNLQSIEDAVIRFLNMLNSHCPGNLAPHLTPDAELQADEEARGLDAVNQFFIRLWDSYPCITFVPENIIVSESGAAAEVTYEAGPGGKGARCMVFSFKGDKIRRIRCY